MYQVPILVCRYAWRLHSLDPMSHRQSRSETADLAHLVSATPFGKPYLETLPLRHEMLRHQITITDLSGRNRPSLLKYPSHVNVVLCSETVRLGGASSLSVHFSAYRVRVSTVQVRVPVIYCSSNEIEMGSLTFESWNLYLTIGSLPISPPILVQSLWPFSVSSYSCTQSMQPLARIELAEIQ